MADVGMNEGFQVWLRNEIQNSDINNTIEGLYSTWADKDAAFPYLVYRFNTDSFLNDRTIASGTLTVDIWDYNQLERTVLQLREQLVGLLDNRLVKGQEISDIYSSLSEYNGDNIVSAIRLQLESDRQVPTDTDDVWRRELRFSVRYDRKRDISNILNRKKILWDLS